VSTRAGKWEKKRFMGTELRGKTLGIVGLGKIGLEVGKRARGFEMELVGYDPYISAEQARAAGVELMTIPGRLLDFFSLEASEYLARLELLLTKKGMDSSDATQFAAAARGLRGGAPMAKAGEPARLAAAVERIAPRVVACVPGCATDIECKALDQAVRPARARSILLWEGPAYVK